MSYQPQFPGIFSPAQGATRASERTETLPATEKQVHFALSLAAKAGVDLPEGFAKDRAALSAWIDGHRPKPAEGPFADYPSSKQVAFAERIARLKRRTVPQECFRDKKMMSRWIDSNKPR